MPGSIEETSWYLQRFLKRGWGMKKLDSGNPLGSTCQQFCLYIYLFWHPYVIVTRGDFPKQNTPRRPISGTRYKISKVQTVPSGSLV